MEFKEYSKAVMAWVDGVMQNRGVDAEKTLKYCADIEQYAKQTGEPKLLGFAYYYAGETYYVLNEGEQLLKTITRAITYLDQAEQWDMVARAYNILAIAFLNRGNTPIALDYYLTGLGYCKKYKLANEENVINLNLGTLYLGNEQWNEAQRYFEKVSSDIKAYPKTPNYYGLMSCVAVCLGRCFMQREQNERVQAQLDYLDQVCWEHMQKIERLSALIFKAEYYHRVGRITLREECIEQIRGLVDMDMAVMDIFDDVYGLCRLLLEIDKEDVFWDIVAVLEKLTKNANIANLQRKIVSLKILCYRRKQDEAAYLEEAGRFYELTEALDRENHYMIANMLSVRRSLEHANEKRREMEKANERLLEKSETDPLTRLANRFRLNDYLEHAFERARDDHRAFAVEILDIDYFKEYNDNYGHQAGDACIVAIADELRKMQSRDTFCARYGGDEFIIIYEYKTEDEVFSMADSLRERILDRRIEHVCSKALPVVTISQGICFDVAPEGSRSWDFLHAADMMLYEVKKRSRNNISLGHLDAKEARYGEERKLL
ncbi:diguanylate cyclase domain-containing protein [Roseburia hominis]|jgi:response regulator|uniref:diguanylate cyclase domain-containing protein n=1 Tax=Roseburia hominis TaxID=301301 RepID=UPI0034A1E8E8